MFVYLYGGHLSVSPPAEVLKLQRIVTKPHWTSIHSGAFLHLELHMVQVWEIMIWPRSKQTHQSHDSPAHIKVIPVHCYIYVCFSCYSLVAFGSLHIGSASTPPVPFITRLPNRASNVTLAT